MEPTLDEDVNYVMQGMLDKITPQDDYTIARICIKVGLYYFFITFIIYSLSVRCVLYIAMSNAYLFDRK